MSARTGPAGRTRRAEADRWLGRPTRRAGCTTTSGRFAAAVAGRRGQLLAAGALTMAQKEATVTKLKGELEDATAVVGFNFKGVSVKDMEDLRCKMPDDTSLIVCKNRLLKRAAADVGGWEGFDEFATGANCFMFVREDIPGSFKPLRALQKEKKKEGAEYDGSLTGGVCDNKFLTMDDIKALEKLPSKMELIAKIAGSIKQVPTKLAVGVKQVPTKLAIGIKAVSEGDAEPADQAA